MVGHELYKEHAELYASFSTRSVVNVGYDRPAIMRLVGDVEGKRVVELGCAGGSLTELLVDRGASVVGLDRESRMVELAGQRLGDRARFEVADAAEPLPVATGSADLVVASLVLHYLADWTALLAELRRCLVPSGAVVFSIHHPITGWLRSDGEDYHRVEPIDEAWDWDGLPVTGTMYRRPVSAVFQPLLRAGFALDAIEEPLPETTEGADERTARVLRTMPVFLFVRAVLGA